MNITATTLKCCRVATDLWWSGKRWSEVAGHCLPLHANPGLPWCSPIQLLTVANPAWLTSSDKLWLVWVIQAPWQWVEMTICQGLPYLPLFITIWEDNYHTKGRENFTSSSLSFLVPKYDQLVLTSVPRSHSGTHSGHNILPPGEWLPSFIQCKKKNECRNVMEMNLIICFRIW